MTRSVEEFDENRVSNILPISTEQLSKQEDDLVKRTAAQAHNIEILGATGSSSLEGRVTTADFPFLALESIKAGLAQEEIVNNKLRSHIKEAEELQKKIDLLLDLSAELTAHKDDVKELSSKTKALLADLKERGIDIWKGEEKSLSKEKISELKTLTSAQVDKLRSELQIIFTTKVQVQIQTIGSIMEALKDIIRNNNKLVNAANRLPGR